MRIKSPFKDYYDHVAFQYGGGDPKIVYPRVRLADRDPEYGCITMLYPEGLKGIPSLPGYFWKQSEFDFKWLAITGKLYLIVREYSITGDKPWSVYREGIFQKLDSLLIQPRWHEARYEYSNWVGRSCDKLIPIHRALKAPVFYISQSLGPYGVEGDVPNLGDLGIAALISPEQIYQDLSYFMGNIINESPDLMPEAKPPMTDKERVLSHGFDIKKSFRHRA
jgi:hypothetical protein